MTENEFAELAAGHALGALSPADERAFQDALATHPEWAAIADRDAATAAALGQTVAPADPPPALRGSLLAAIDDLPQQPVEPELVAAADVPDALGADPGTPVAAVPATRRGWSRAWFALAASLALILAIAGITTVVGQANRPAAVVALERIEAAPDAQQADADIAGGGAAVLHWSESLGEAVLVADELPDIDAGQAYEAWFVRDGAPISAGVFEPREGDGTTTALLESGVEPGDLVALTVEPAGGSPTGAPTSDPILAIQTS